VTLGAEPRTAALLATHRATLARQPGQRSQSPGELLHAFDDAQASARHAVLTTVTSRRLERKRAHRADRALHELGRSRRALMAARTHDTLVVTR